MRPRFVIVVFELLVLVFAFRNIVSAQPPSSTEISHRLYLNSYEAVAEDDLSLCNEDKDCVEEATMIQSWSCVVDVCKATKSTKNPQDMLRSQLECLDDVTHSEDQDELASSMCALIKSPSSVTRKEFLRHTSVLFPLATEDSMVQIGAYLMALNGSGKACTTYVKNYVGPYGLNWKYKWYKVLAGCRILSYEISREEQERNFSNWYNEGWCLGVTDHELRKACDAARGVLSFDD